MKVLVVAEHRGGELREVTAELVGAATQLAGEVDLLLLAADPAGLVPGAQLAGVDRIVVARAPGDAFAPEIYRHAVCEAVRAVEAEVVVAPHSIDGIAYAAAVAAELEAAFASDVIALAEQDGGLSVERQIYGGKVSVAMTLPAGERAVLSVRPTVFPPAEASGEVPVEELAVDFGAVPEWTVVEGTEAAARREVDLSAADFIVAAGRGFEEERHLELAREVAERMGATLAASRPVVDAGWLPHDRQVGSSGQTVAPTVYFAVGISGSTQHVAGMRKSGTIVALNNDPEAAIFEIADVGVVGDLHEVLPALLERLRGG